MLGRNAFLLPSRHHYPLHVDRLSFFYSKIEWLFVFFHFRRKNHIPHSYTFNKIFTIGTMPLKTPIIVFLLEPLRKTMASLLIVLHIPLGKRKAEMIQKIEIPRRVWVVAINSSSQKLIRWFNNWLLSNWFNELLLQIHSSAILFDLCQCGF